MTRPRDMNRRRVVRAEIGLWHRTQPGRGLQRRFTSEQEIQDAVRHFVEIAYSSRLFAGPFLKLGAVRLLPRIRGGASGLCCVDLSPLGQAELLFAADDYGMSLIVVTHEVAHYLDFASYRNKDLLRRVAAHNPHWASTHIVLLSLLYRQLSLDLLNEYWQHGVVLDEMLLLRAGIAPKDNEAHRQADKQRNAASSSPAG